MRGSCRAELNVWHSLVFATIRTDCRRRERGKAFHLDTSFRGRLGKAFEYSGRLAK